MKLKASVEPADLLEAHRDLEDLTGLTDDELREQLKETEGWISFGTQHGAEEIFITMLRNDIRGIRAELTRRSKLKTETPTESAKTESPEGEEAPNPVEEILQQCGLQNLQPGASLAAVEDALRALSILTTNCDDLRRELLREAVIKKLTEIGIKAPGRLIDAALGSNEKRDSADAGKPLFLVDPEPWESPVEGNRLLQNIESLLRKHVIVAPEGICAAALWICYSWSMECFDVAPLLYITSPTKRCGKTRLLEIVALLSRRSISASNITAPALFRLVEKFNPTLCIDEADAFLGQSEELRGILNSGHRRSNAFVVRCASDAEDFEPRIFLTWAPKAIAGIGKIAPTLEDRSIIISMKRRAPGERIEPLRHNQIGVELETLRRKIARWAKDHIEALKASDPEVPGALNDRQADNWRPLLAIADVAGADWPERARAAAVALSEIDEADDSALVDLLKELHEIFQSTDKVFLSDLTERLGSNPESRFCEWRHGRPITQRQVGRIIGSLGIKSRSIRIGVDSKKGYQRDWFSDAFARYLPEPPISSGHSVTTQQNQLVRPDFVRSQKSFCDRTENGLSMEKIRLVTNVTERKPQSTGDGGDVEEELL
ncbi:MAG TPA: DUF3631 domain-containing protein [Candidatus Binatia bacterium]|nr:DUF3631 domain-containing protein [Candidatus Binatia bacterium]